MFSLLALSYDRSTPIIARYLDCLQHVLGTCHRCAREYHIQLLTIRKLILEEFYYDEDAVDEFMTRVNSWNSERLVKLFAATEERLKDIQIQSLKISKVCFRRYSSVCVHHVCYF